MSANGAGDPNGKGYHSAHVYQVVYRCICFLPFAGMETCHLPEWKPAICRNENLPFAGMKTCHLLE